MRLEFNRKILVMFFFANLMCFASSASAWVISADTKIGQMIQWEQIETVNTGKNVVLKLADDSACYVPLTETALYSLVLSLYMANKTVSVHCYDDVANTINIGGYTAHKLYRIIAK